MELAICKQAAYNSFSDVACRKHVRYSYHHTKTYRPCLINSVYLKLERKRAVMSPQAIMNS